MLAYDPDRSYLVLMNFGSRGVTGAAAYVRAAHRATSRPGLPTAARVGGHWESGTAALLKAVWWDLRLASLLTQLFISCAYLLNLVHCSHTGVFYVSVVDCNSVFPSN